MSGEPAAKDYLKIHIGRPCWRSGYCPMLALMCRLSAYTSASRFILALVPLSAHVWLLTPAGDGKVIYRCS